MITLMITVIITIAAVITPKLTQLNSYPFNHPQNYHKVSAVTCCGVRPTREGLEGSRAMRPMAVTTSAPLLVC